MEVGRGMQEETESVGGVVCGLEVGEEGDGLARGRRRRRWRWLRRIVSDDAFHAQQCLLIGGYYYMTFIQT